MKGLEMRQTGWLPNDLSCLKVCCEVQRSPLPPEISLPNTAVLRHHSLLDTGRLQADHSASCQQARCQFLCPETTMERVQEKQLVIPMYPDKLDTFTAF